MAEGTGKPPRRRAARAQRKGKGPPKGSPAKAPAQNSGGSANGAKRPVSLLRADPKNARQISKASLEGLGASMGEFGDLAGITWNEKLGDLVAGHQRMKRLRANGAKTWERLGPEAGVIVDPKTGKTFPIRIVGWDETKHRLAQIAANNPEIQGDFTPEAIEQLRALETDARYHELQLAELAAALHGEMDDKEAEAKGGLTDPDEGTEPPDEPYSKRGDLWLLGEHRLLCGDSTSDADLTRLMGGARAVLMSTDPPYGIDYTATKAGMPVSGLGDAQERWGDIENDNLTSGPELQEFLEKVIRAAVPRLTKTTAFYLWHPMLTQGTFFAAAAAAADILIHRQIIWVKPGFVLTRSGMYHWQHELCFFGWMRGHGPPWYGEKNQTSVWPLGKDDGKAVHPTQKPVALFEIPMLNHTREGEICYEPFSGSGSQIIAGERLGRRVYAMELSPRWVDAAVARWEGFTGKKAKLERGAEEQQPAPEVRDGV